MNNVSKFSATHDKSSASAIVGAGLISLDVVVVDDSKYRFYAGGTCGNVLAILGYLGWNATAVARHAKEPATRRIVEDLRKWNVQTDFMHLGTTTRPPIIFHRITRAADGTARHKFSLTCPECGEWLPQYRPVSAVAMEGVLPKINDAKVYFFDRISRSTVDLARHLKGRGAVVMMEPSGVGDRRLFGEALQYVDILKYAEDRIRELPEFTRPESLLEIQTLGDEGLRYRPAGEESRWQFLPAIAASKVVDAAGCGDWTSAGFLHALAIEGKFDREVLFNKARVEAALRFGQSLATWNCGYEGARGGMYAISKAEFWQMTNAIFEGAPPSGSKTLKRGAAHRALVASLCAACSDGSASFEISPAQVRRENRVATARFVHNLDSGHK